MKNIPGVTRGEGELLWFVDDFTRRNGGVAPRLADIGAALGRSKTAIHRAAVALHRKGLLRRLPRRMRAIEVVGRTVAEFR